MFSKYIHRLWQTRDISKRFTQRQLKETGNTGGDLSERKNITRQKSCVLGN